MALPLYMASGLTQLGLNSLRVSLLFKRIHCARTGYVSWWHLCSLCQVWHASRMSLPACLLACLLASCSAVLACTQAPRCGHTFAARGRVKERSLRLNAWGCSGEAGAAWRCLLYGLRSHSARLELSSRILALQTNTLCTHGLHQLVASLFALPGLARLAHVSPRLLACLLACLVLCCPRMHTGTTL